MRGQFAKVQTVAECAVALIPAISRLRLLRHWGGIQDMTPDGSPFICKTPARNLYLNGGWCYQGFKATPASGWTRCVYLFDRPADLRAGQVAKVSAALRDRILGRVRAIGLLIALGLAAKIIGERPLAEPPLRHWDGWNIAIAPLAHLTGALSGALTALLCLTLRDAKRAAKRGGPRPGDTSPS